MELRDRKGHWFHLVKDEANLIYEKRVNDAGGGMALIRVHVQDFPLRASSVQSAVDLCDLCVSFCILWIAMQPSVQENRRAGGVGRSRGAEAKTP